jgi:hypothetical protein
VVAVDRMPGDTEAARAERSPGGVEQARDRREAVPQMGAVRGLARRWAVRMPEAVVVGLVAADTLPARQVAGVRDDPGPAVEEADGGFDLVALGVVGGVAGGDGEAHRDAGDGSGVDPPQPLRHGLDDVVGQRLLGPVGAHRADQGGHLGVVVTEPVEVLGSPRTLGVGHVEVGDLGQGHEAAQTPGGPDASEVGAYSVALCGTHLETPVSTLSRRGNLQRRPQEADPVRVEQGRRVSVVA